MARPLTGNALNFLINHVVLPPLLPQSDDSSPTYELELVQFARIQAIAFEDEGPHGFKSKGALMGAMSALSDGGRFSSQQLTKLTY